MGCIESVKHEILLKNASFQECRDFVRAHFKEHYIVAPGYRIFEKPVIGIPPILIAVEGDDVIFPYTKPCYGTFLLRATDRDEAYRLKSGVNA
ncbi:MAG: DUF1894 domain-containing protein [Methanomicrobiales archaeon]|jgi:hypothetical protein|nr:DUF1894 domain-containing protein [Methanomicrobiales archaeon]